MDHYGRRVPSRCRERVDHWCQHGCVENRVLQPNGGGRCFWRSGAGPIAGHRVCGTPETDIADQGSETLTTPRRGLLFHLTHISNLPSIVTDGLYSDSDMMDSQQLVTEIGHPEIKARRRDRPVPLPPGGVVADYVPFYFAARSPMLFLIARGSVPTYAEGQDEVVHLLTSVEDLSTHGLRFVFTDRNAALGYARYGRDPQVLDQYIDWEIMEARMWRDTTDEPDRKEKRMAELLVHRHVPWQMISFVVTKNEQLAQRARRVLDNVQAMNPVYVESGWYF